MEVRFSLTWAQRCRVTDAGLHPLTARVRNMCLRENGEAVWCKCPVIDVGDGCETLVLPDGSALVWPVAALRSR